jgi:hypothetical protein
MRRVTKPPIPAGFLIQTNAGKQMPWRQQCHQQKYEETREATP